VDILGTLSGGILSGVGKFAKDIRESITGKEILTSEERKIILDKTNELEKLALEADKSIALAQIELNKEEAKSDSLFKSGWRPMVGWACVTGLIYQMLIRTILPWILQAICLLTGQNIVLPPLPELEINSLMTLLFGILGLGGFRTFEKVKGIK
jgi:hypothetical protein